jgi:hypothetical protein
LLLDKTDKKQIKENSNDVYKTNVVVLQSCNAFGGIHSSIAVPPQLVAISPMGRLPNA